MLSRLSVSNVALIDKQDIDLFDGFSVLTGETGAGKSILIEALNFALGERASRELIKSGAQKACVEATFLLRNLEPVLPILSEHALESDGHELVLHREFSDAGKSICRVNGVLVSATQLKQIGDALVDIHGQHEHQSLLNPKQHIKMLDSFGGEELLTTRQTLHDLYETASAAGKKLRAAEIDERERERRCDLLAYQLKEIDTAALSESEEAELIEKRSLLQNAQTIIEVLSDSVDSLSGETGVITLLSGTLKALNRIVDYQPGYLEIRDLLQETYYRIEDAAYSTRDYRDGFSYEPEQLDQVEWRLEKIAQLKRKYGDSVTDVLKYREEISEEYELLISNEEQRAVLQDVYQAAQRVYVEKANELSKLRQQAAESLKQKLLPELTDLGISHAVFDVRFDRLPGEVPSANGVDAIEFLISTNLGEPVKPLAKVASGGEISRIMLAFKSVLATIDGIPTMVFDEIDSGVSGVIGTAVAEKMKQISAIHQVLCITHLPQIAAAAQKQYLVFKETSGDQTFSRAKLLTSEERVHEIARIMGDGSIDVLALAHAKSLLDGVL